MFRSHFRRRSDLRRPQRGISRPYSIERLETRELLSALGLNAPDPVAQPAHFGGYSSPLSPNSQTPDMIRFAYGFPAPTTSNGLTTIANDGSGKTIAIVDAYGDSNIASDLDAFDKTFGTSTYWGNNPAPSDFTRSSSQFFSKLNENGLKSSFPANNSGWALETALDVEWAHSIAPGANIVLVEANSANTSDLLKAVDTASNQPGVVAVSMSWGASEFAGETADDGHFSHSGITYVAASGDTGGQVIWPSASPNVLSVGGTSLTTNWPSGETNKNGPFPYEYEIGWQQSGGGVSAYEAQPNAQTQSGLVKQSSTNRVTPDVAFDADPGSGVAVYSSANGGWSEVGGTSAGAPQWAGLAALADQLRSSPLSSLQADVYSVATSSGISPTITPSDVFAPYFNDVTVPAIGYDTVTGIGSPQAGNLIQALASLSTDAAAAVTTGASGSGGTAGTGAAVAAASQTSVPIISGAAMASGVTPAADGSSAGSAVAVVIQPSTAAQATDALFASYAYSQDDDTLA